MYIRNVKGQERWVQWGREPTDCVRAVSCQVGKVKVTFALEQATNAQMVSRPIALLFL
jgi:hypothetical protein